MTINKPYPPKTKTFLKKNKLLPFFLFLPVLLLALAITFWAVQSKKSPDIKEKEILLITPSFQPVTTQNKQTWQHGFHGTDISLNLESIIDMGPESIDLMEKIAQGEKAEILLIQPSSPQKASTQTTHIKSMWRYDPQHTGRSSYIGPVKAPTREWRYRGIEHGSAVISSNRTIYIYGDSTFYAFDTNGTVKWSFKADTNIGNKYILAPDGTIYLADKNSLYALNPGENPTPRVKWKFKIDGGTYGHPILASDGTIYIGSQNKYLYALTPDGTIKWQFEGDGSSYPTALALDGTIYMASITADKRFYYALNPGENPTPRVKWKTEISGGYAVIAPDGTIYITSNYYIYALNPDTGTVKWNYKTTKIARMAVAKDGTIYFTETINYYSYLRALNPGENPDKRLKWTYNLSRQYYFPGSPVVDANGNIFVGCHYYALFAISPEGKTVWKLTVNPKLADIEAEIALDECGNIYVTGDDWQEKGFSKWKNPDGCPEGKANLSITKQDNPDPVEIESLLTYTLTITNNGPDTAGQVQVTDTLPAQEFYFNSASSSQGTCSHTSGIVACDLGSMASGAQATITIDGYVYGLPQGKKLTNKAIVSSSTNDPDSSNNQAEEDTWVHEYEDPSPSPSPSPDCHKADYNNDGKIDPADLAVFLSYWGTSNSNGDFNNDNVVNAADLAIFLSYWGPCP